MSPIPLSQILAPETSAFQRPGVEATVAGPAGKSVPVRLLVDSGAPATRYLSWVSPINITYLFHVRADYNTYWTDPFTLPLRQVNPALTTYSSTSINTLSNGVGMYSTLIGCFKLISFDLQFQVQSVKNVRALAHAQSSNPKRSVWGIHPHRINAPRRDYRCPECNGYPQFKQGKIFG